MVSLSKIVNANFKVAEQTVATGSYPKTLLMTPNAIIRYKEYADLAAVAVDFASGQPEHDAATLYFNNGGQVLVIGQIDGVETLLVAVQAVELEFTDFIFVAFLEKDNDSAEAIALVTNFDARFAPNKRIACFTVTTATAKDGGDATDLMSLIKAQNLKSATAKYTSAGLYDGILIGAYFSAVNLSGVETVKDYMFTSEAGPVSEDIIDAEYDALIAKDYNFVTTIGRKTLNYGGNTSGSIGIETLFGTIAVENDVSQAVFDTITSKEYLTDTGSNNIVTAAKAAIVRHITNGFISPDATYLGETQVINYNSIEFQTIRRGQTLSLGYLIFTIPVANISAADRTARKLPPISIFINARGSIRKVEIVGEVRE